MGGLAAEASVAKTVMIDVSRRTPCVRVSLRKYLKAHRTATRLRSKKGGRRPEGPFDRPDEGRHEHQAARRHRRRWPPIRVFMTAGQVSDYTGAAALLGSLPQAEWLLADRGYDAD